MHVCGLILQKYRMRKQISTYCCYDHVYLHALLWVCECLTLFPLSAKTTTLTALHYTRAAVQVVISYFALIIPTHIHTYTDIIHMHVDLLSLGLYQYHTSVICKL